jgi:hypothetical protein
MMSNNSVRSVTCVEEDNICMNNVEELQLMKPDAMIPNDNKIMAQLILQIEVQKKTINQLLSTISEMKSI